MAPGQFNSSLTRVRPFFEAAIAADLSGQSWLGPLIAVAPKATALPREVREKPGKLLAALLAERDHNEHGKVVRLRGCFEHPIPPTDEFLAWCIDNPDRLTWPPGKTYSPETTKWRRALLDDEPPGRDAAQREARSELATAGAARSVRKWWAFEGTTSADCVLATEKLVLLIEGKRTDKLSPATDWYPARSQLVRNLEAARQVARGRAFATLLMTEEHDPDGTFEAVADSLDDAAPHVAERDRAELQNSYLGQITWRDACERTGVIDCDALPDTIDDF